MRRCVNHSRQAVRVRCAPAAPWRPLLAAGLALALLGTAGCAEPKTDPAPLPGPAPADFSGPLAQAHADALAGLGPRSPRSEPDSAARLYVSRAFRAAGAPVTVLPDGDRRHLVAELEGDSPDALLLLASYPTAPGSVGAREPGDTGAGLLLELARVLGRERPAYTIRLALAEVRPTGPPGSDPGLGRALVAAGGPERFRGVVVFDLDARPALRILRDLRSHPIYRELFWSSAAALGYGDTFPADAGWASRGEVGPAPLPRPTDRVVALVDEARARPDLARAGPGRELSADSFERVGRVTVEALGRIMARLARIDAFDASPAGPATEVQASPPLPEIPPSS